LFDWNSHFGEDFAVNSPGKKKKKKREGPFLPRIITNPSRSKPSPRRATEEQRKSVTKPLIGSDNLKHGIAENERDASQILNSAQFVIQGLSTVSITPTGANNNIIKKCTNKLRQAGRQSATAVDYAKFFSRSHSAVIFFTRCNRQRE